MKIKYCEINTNKPVCREADKRRPERQQTGEAYHNSCRQTGMTAKKQLLHI